MVFAIRHNWDAVVFLRLYQDLVILRQSRQLPYAGQGLQGGEPDAMIAAAVQRADRIMQKINRVYTAAVSSRRSTITKPVRIPD
jgi:hypothetical protein